MPSSFITVDGTELLIKRVHRAAIDSFVAAHPEPRPPTIEVEIWGGLKEELPNFDDVYYLHQLRNYNIGLGQAQMPLLLSAVEVVGDTPEPSKELLTLLGKRELTDLELLQMVILGNKSDLEQVVEEVLYLSTVTARGIVEAQQAFNVEWLDKPVASWKIPGLPATYSSEFRDRQVAQFCHYTWSSFCELTGPEQSKCVVYYLSDKTLEYLSSKWR